MSMPAPTSSGSSGTSKRDGHEEATMVRAARSGKRYDDLPAKVRDVIGKANWHRRMSSACARARLPWSVIRQAMEGGMSEQDYLAQVIKTSTLEQRLFPYHLMPNRLLASDPFTFYVALLHGALKKDQSYDQIPNFTAADAVRVTGVGRLEYVAILNACKAKRLLWKVNRDSVVRENLPSEAQDLAVEGWWRLVPTREAFARRAALDSSSPPPPAAEGERALLDRIMSSQGWSAIAIRDVQDNSLWREMYRRGLLHVDVPITEEDCIAVPPLEGFVSNKDTDEDTADPLEKLLYSMFFAASARTTIKELSFVLGAPIEQVCQAASLACRLGFARRSTQERRLSLTPPLRPLPDGEGAALPGCGADEAEGWQVAKGVAFVIDTEVTATLMMGSLLKDQRHAVTLFEAGKLSGRLAIRELFDELSRVPLVGRYEGEVQSLVNTIVAMHAVLRLLLSDEVAAEEVDVLRYEVLANLQPPVLRKMLGQQYKAVVFMADPPVPLLPLEAAPNASKQCEGVEVSLAVAVHGAPSQRCSTPWLHLTAYGKAGRGPVSLVLPKGTRLTHVPACLLDTGLGGGSGEAGARLLVWRFPEADKNRRGGKGLMDKNLLVPEGALTSLNDQLMSSALMVQRLDGVYLDSLAEGGTNTFEVPLPLPAEGSAVDPGVMECIHAVGVEMVVGYVTFLRAREGSETVHGSHLLSVHFGVPLHSVELCQSVCSASLSLGVLEQGPRGEASKEAMLALSGEVDRIASAHSHPDCLGEPYLPSLPVLFDGRRIVTYELGE